MRVVGDIRGLSRRVLRQFSGGALLNVLKGHRDAFRYPADRLLA